MTTVADRKAQLEARRDDLNRRMQEIDAELDSHDSKDWEELATERETDEVLEDLGLSAQQELRMIDAAILPVQRRLLAPPPASAVSAIALTGALPRVSGQGDGNGQGHGGTGAQRDGRGCR